MMKKLKSFAKNYLLKKKAYRFLMRDWIQLTDLQVAADVFSTMRFSQNLQPLKMEGTNAKRILVLAPHPDDETIGPGGTLLQEIKKGAKVFVVYLTCGTSNTSEKLKKEAENIAAKYKYDIMFLKYFSKKIPLNKVLLESISQIINQFSPEILFLPFLLDDHDDHRRASHILLLLERKQLLKTRFEIWAYQVYTPLLPNVIVDITSIADEKRHMIQMWKTQNKVRDWSHYSLGLNAFNQRFLPNTSDAKYAESFFVLPLSEYLNYCAQYFKRPADCYYNPSYKEQVDECTVSQ